MTPRHRSASACLVFAILGIAIVSSRVTKTTVATTTVVPAADPAPADEKALTQCTVSEWSEWGPCTGECEEAQRLRNRDVISLPFGFVEEDNSTVTNDICPELFQAERCIPDFCEEYSVEVIEEVSETEAAPDAISTSTNAVSTTEASSTSANAISTKNTSSEVKNASSKTVEVFSTTSVSPKSKETSSKTKETSSTTKNTSLTTKKAATTTTEVDTTTTEALSTTDVSSTFSTTENEPTTTTEEFSTTTDELSTTTDTVDDTTETLLTTTFPTKSTKPFFAPIDPRSLRRVRVHASKTFGSKALRENCGLDSQCCRLARFLCPDNTHPQKVIRWHRRRSDPVCRPYEYPLCSDELEDREKPFYSEGACQEACFTDNERLILPLSRIF